MLSKTVAAIREFNTCIETKTRDTPGVPAVSEQELWADLLAEEYDEYMVAKDDGDVVEVADALADMLYIIVGNALVWGIPLNEVLEEVHRTNMLKFPGGKLTRRADGKVTKPEGWKAPDIKAILLKHGWKP